MLDANGVVFWVNNLHYAQPKIHVGKLSKKTYNLLNSCDLAKEYNTM